MHEAVKRTLFVWLPKRFFFVPFISVGIVKIGSRMEPLIMILGAPESALRCAQGAKVIS